MATVGGQLLAPEAGWKRYDNTDSKISYSGIDVTSGGSDTRFYNKTYTQGTSLTAKFNFIGTKLRLISWINVGSNYTDNGTISIDGIQVTTFSELGASALGQALVAEIGNLKQGEHSVIISCSSGYMLIDAIDIDEAGELKPYSSIAAPANLIAIAGDAQVNLSWAVVSGATGYNVKRSTTAGGPYTTIASNVSSTSYVDSTVTNGATYYYVVTALNGTAESANSNEASATPVAATKSLLRVTMNDSSEREYQLSSTDINSFITWFNRIIGTGTTGYVFNKTAQNSKEYLSFEKIISFEVIPLAK